MGDEMLEVEFSNCRTPFLVKVWESDAVLDSLILFLLEFNALIFLLLHILIELEKLVLQPAELVFECLFLVFRVGKNGWDQPSRKYICELGGSKTSS